MKKNSSFHFFDTREIVKKKIIENGGWVNTHSHLDRAFSLSRESFPSTSKHLHEKWILVNELKKNSTVDSIYDRMAYAVENMISQKVQAVGSFIDVDELIEDKSIKAATRIRDKYKKNIKIKFINGSTYKGLLDRKQQKWFELGAQFADIIGGLPAKDKGREEEHVDTILSAAKRMKKMVHAHVDQLNTPSEKETELLCKKTLEYNMQGKVVAIHSVSLSAHNKKYRKYVYNLMNNANLMVSCCPSAWIDDKRREDLVVSHNSIAPVEELDAYGVTVGLGTDNIYDIYKPFSDGNLWTELRFLLESCHFYNIERLVKIATSNGLKILGIS